MHPCLVRLRGSVVLNLGCVVNNAHTTHSEIVNNIQDPVEVRYHVPKHGGTPDMTEASSSSQDHNLIADCTHHLKLVYAARLFACLHCLSPSALQHSGGRPVVAKGGVHTRCVWSSWHKEGSPVVCFSVCSVSGLLGSLQRWCSPDSPSGTGCRCAAGSPAVPVHWPHLRC